jgi:two-component system cell cycle sensor histidine kinase/response regulator CckA
LDSYPRKEELVIQPERNTLETILVVEDHPVVREAVCDILERAGFCVLSAGSGAQAIEVDSFTEGTIHLLLSDVMMPGMSGPVLAQLLKQHRPEMRVMLMSGYPDGDMLLLNHGWHFIEKPFLPSDLVKRANELLHTPERSQGDDHFDTRIQPKTLASGV